MAKSKLCRSSFTLLEIIIVSGIIALLSGFALARFNLLREKQKLDTQVQKLVQFLELARTKALSGDISLCSAGPLITQRLSQFAITVDSTNSYIFEPKCASQPEPTKYRQTIESGVVFLTPTVHISFDTKGHTPATFCLPLQNNSINACSYVAVSAVGLITSGSCSSCFPITCSCQ